MPSWDALPTFAVETLTIRCGSAPDAQAVCAGLAQWLDQTADWLTVRASAAGPAATPARGA
jgi:hypothetical protein